jgi:hypothetical protein
MARKNKESEQFVSRGKAGRQLRRVRRDGWTARKREIFLDEYATHGNAAAACRAAGMDEGAAYRLRRRDPEFAEQYDQSLAVAMLRLEEMAIQYAKSGGRMAAVEPGEIPPVDIANFDPELALKILNRNRASQAGGKPAGAKPRRASKAELTAVILKYLAVLKRLRAKRCA